MDICMSGIRHWVYVPLREALEGLATEGCRAHPTLALPVQLLPSCQKSTDLDSNPVGTMDVHLASLSLSFLVHI